MMLKLSLQFFAHKKGVGSTKNGRDSESKRLGVKDYTLYALIDGKVKFEHKSKTQKKVSVYAD